MLDPKFFRDELAFTTKKLAQRGFKLDVNKIEQLEAERKTLQIETQALQSDRNNRSKAIGQAKAAGKDVGALLNEINQLGGQLTAREEQLSNLQQQLQDIYLTTPNICHESVPEGKDEQDNVQVRQWGKIPLFTFPIKDHVDLGEGNGLMDFAVASKITGSRFVVLRRQMAKLQRALIQFMLDVHTEEHGYHEVYVPYLVNADSLLGTGQLPKFADDLFFTNSEQNYALIPTAEVPVTNLFRDEIIASEELPIKLVAHTPCFRKEAGSYGRDTRGMIRQHQFEKIEMVQIVKPENSYQALEDLTAHAEAILQKLGLPYQVMSLCTGDMGANAAKTYDLEVWLPSQNTYREISSCSNFEAFQARRMQARWRDKTMKKPELVHTLNGSGLAVGRTLVAIIENYQDVDGKIHVPEVLWPYMQGCHSI